MECGTSIKATTEDALKLRDYQHEAHQAVLREWKDVCNTLVCMPTGAGKTVLFASLIQAMQPKRAIVLAHRRELIYQARDVITRATGLECGIEMADKYVNNSLFGEMPVVISTIQTQNSSFGDRKRMSRFTPKEFGLLIVDEAHRIVAKGYKDLINYYKQNNPDIKILSVTATPDRADQEALGQVIDSVAYDIEILDCIHGGWLVPIHQQFVHINGLDFSQIRTTAGDLNGADLAAVMEAESNMQGVAAASIEIIKDKRALIFTASVKQAEMVANIFNRHKMGMAEWVCGATNKDRREELLSRFQRGEIQVMANCNCLSEGYDDPGVEVVIQARPTKSRSLYAQQIGRCARPLPGVVDGPPTPDERKAAIAASRKPGCLVVDFVGNSGKHKLMTTADILGGKVSDEAVKLAVEKAKKGAVRMDEALDDAQEELFAMAEARRRAEEERKSKLVARVNYSTRVISPFDAFDLQPVKERGWDNQKKLSEKQLAVLRKQGVNADKMPYAQAKQLLNTMFQRWENKLATLKQCQLLKKHGYEVKYLSMADASKLISQLAANNWKRPNEEPKESNAPF